MLYSGHAFDCGLKYNLEQSARDNENIVSPGPKRRLPAQSLSFQGLVSQYAIPVVERTAASSNAIGDCCRFFDILG